MTVFLSYSHRDMDVARRLSTKLVARNIKVWRDEWKLSPGDSLTERINAAIEGAAFLCVLLSDSAVASEWVRREVEAGLLRRAEAGPGLTVIPVIVGDCTVPEELSDLIQIDFRPDFDEGVEKLVYLIERRYSVTEASGAGEDADYFFFYGSETGTIDGRVFLDLQVVSVDREEQFCVVTDVAFRGNEAATFDRLRERQIDSPKAYILAACAQTFAKSPAHVKVTAHKPASGSFFVASADEVIRFDAKVNVKLLGIHEGETLLFNFGALFQQICWRMRIDWEEPGPSEPDAHRLS